MSGTVPRSAGVHWLQGQAVASSPSLSIAHQSIGGSALAGARWLPFRRLGPIRLRIGLDLRLGVASDLTFRALHQTIDPVSALTVFIGLEPSPPP